jgi:Protein of unknown function (DUF3160)
MRRLIIVVFGLLLLAAPVVAQVSFGNSNPFAKTKKDYAAELDREPTLDDIFPKTDFTTAYNPPIPLSGLKFPALSETAVKVLGVDYFVAVNDTKRKTFAEIYRENRTIGRSNFVTAVSLVHPALAHHNTIVASVIASRLRPQLASLLKAIYDSSVRDYENSEDIPVKEDIDRNLAFLAVAIRLIAPDTKLNESDHVKALVEADLPKIQKEAVDYSAVFKRKEDFAVYHPLGFYAATPSLQNYYRCRQWLGRTYLLLSDITDEAGLGTGNEFRRAVLLYRSLYHARFGEATGMKAWTNLSNLIALLEPGASATADGVLSPKNFETVFPPTEEGFKTTLDALSNPIERARLFLTLKGRERPELNTKSVFELVKKTGKEHDRLSFRLFPSISQPEMEWLAAQKIQKKDATEGFSTVPVGLFFLHARGFRMATNILADNTYRFDEALAFALSGLTKIEGGQPIGTVGAAPDRPEKKQAVRQQPVEAKTTWQIFDNYANSKPPNAQTALRSPTWLGCCLESVIAGWVDGLTAIDREALIPKKTTETAKTGDQATPAAPAAAKPPPPPLAARGPIYHYLEPVPELYGGLSQFLENFEADLTQLGLFPEQLRQRNQDFVRLSKRFFEISNRELANRPLEPNDVSLLANIDQIYEQVNYPVQGYVHLQYGQPGTRETGDIGKPASGGTSVLLQSRHAQAKAKPSQPPARPPANSLKAIDLTTANNELMDGFELGKKYADKAPPSEGMNMVIEGPAVLDVILKTSHGAILARGATFSYFEVPGPALSAEHWARKLDYGFVKPPFWCESFQINAMGMGAATKK